MAKQSKSFGAARALKAHLMQQTGGLSAEINDLRKDVEEGFQNNEAKSGFPTLDALDPGTLLAAGQASFVMAGRNLLQGQTFDTLTSGLTTAGFVVTMLKPGDSGVRLKVVQGTGALAAALANGLLTVTLDVGGSTATQVVAAINAEATCIGIVHAAVLSGGGGTVLIAAEAPLAGGVGDYDGNNVYINGQSCDPVQAAAQWTNTSITVLVPALTGRVATDIVAVVVESNGVMTGQLSAVLT